MTYTTTDTWNYMSVPGLPDADLDTITRDVCHAMNVAVENIKDKDKHTELKFARWILWKILFKRGYSCVQLGKLFSMHHTTILYALGKIDHDIKHIPYLQTAWDKVKHHHKSRKRQ